jgi:hypothetical protein
MNRLGDLSGEHREPGEITKEFPGGVVALRWTCEQCHEDTVTVFESDANDKDCECQFCEATAVISRP